MSPLLEQFLTEAREHLSFLDQHLQDLLEADDELINALFRAAHTLKGSGGLAGFEDVKNITHVAEDILDEIRNKRLTPTQDIVDKLYDAFDLVVELIDAAEEYGDIPEYDKEAINEVISSLKSLLNKEESVVEYEFNFINDIFPIGNYIELSCAKEVINSVKFFEEIKERENEYLENENYFIFDLDLDENSILNANDPLYLLSLFNNTPCSIYTFINCEIEDPLLLKTRFIAAIKTNKEEFEEVFYNILDEITVYPLTIETLFLTEYDECDEELLKEFKESFSKNFNDINRLKSSVDAILKIINPKTKEGFLLKRFLDLIDVIEDKDKLIKFVAKELNITLTKEEKTEKILDEKSMAIAKNILSQQLKVLDFAKDEQAVTRVKNILENVLDEKIDIDDREKLKEFIKQKLDINEEEKKESIKEEKSAQKDKIAEKTKKHPVKAHQAEHHKAIPKMVKIDQNQIDLLLDLTGELLVLKNALPYIAENLKEDNILQSKREIVSKYEEISRVLEQMQEKIMDMRLMPLSYIFDRYPKLVRDISKKLGKKVKFIQEGGETKLDKTVIEKLADPLVHVIRNALDHGIETPEERVKKGKSEEGILKISARSAGDKVFITIEDDGAGINVEKVVIKALEKGVITEEQIEKMSESEKLSLIFHPGLSTKEEVTDLSGRGVGSDAIKRVAEELGGKIEVKSQKDKGTTILLELPISVALTNVFHIKANNINYAVAMEHIVETVKISKDQIKTANHLPYITLRGDLVPVIFEKRILKRNDFNDIESMLIIQGKSKRYAFIVDSFVDQLNVVAKPLTGALKNHPFINGASLLGNGEVLFIIDIYKLLDE